MSKEILRPQNKPLAQSAEPPPWWPAVENILTEYGLQAIDFVADFKAALKDAAQQEPVAWMDVDGNVSDNNDHNCFPIALYTTPNIQSYLEKDNSQPAQNEFELRGKLATLLCWHRLTQAEAEDLLRFAAAQSE